MDGSGRHHLHLLSKLNAAKTKPIRGYVPPEGMPGDVATTTTSETKHFIVLNDKLNSAIDVQRRRRSLGFSGQRGLIEKNNLSYRRTSNIF